MCSTWCERGEAEREFGALRGCREAWLVEVPACGRFEARENIAGFGAAECERENDAVSCDREALRVGLADVIGPRREELAERARGIEACGVCVERACDAERRELVAE